MTHGQKNIKFTFLILILNWLEIYGPFIKRKIKEKNLKDIFNLSCSLVILV